eukprot:TRINITY_DN2578_c0_g1_i2.p1 TRINITY_DN2578_c0_g1~~TRINITY_DN2578_c0_g1_i2.p1  ORF type:complete len:358 (+),score=57.93 TRINITY_DN2578_c0_g1_i2:108-1076(+)
MKRGIPLMKPKHTGLTYLQSNSKQTTPVLSQTVRHNSGNHSIPRSAFPFLPVNTRREKPRGRGITEIRAAYYTPMGKRYLEDLLETMGEHIDALKFAGGSFTLYPRQALREIIDMAHMHSVLVSTGGFIERVLTLAGGGKERLDLVDQYMMTCKELGFDIMEISSGFLTLPPEDFVRLISKAKSIGLKPKAEIGIQFGTGGDTPQEVLQSAAASRDIESVVRLGKKCLDAGAYMLMIESEGITENLPKTEWKTNVINTFVNNFGIENLMFEAASPDVFQWYIKSFGPDVNLFVDHSQIVQCEAVRRGIWGTNDLWGRIVTYR